jgi:hypothetical protein
MADIFVKKIYISLNEIVLLVVFLIERNNHFYL